ncbi:hypothetical protein ACTVZO_43255 [Streptomyces sp. IBSNAI002]|uniref:hypothetical protein n=1 Tax=Streptomyces sp. IBSNAI002 TaxID=3457500 RepID=UPI003FCEEE5B
MRYTRPALAAATMLLALTGLGTTAYADDNAKDRGNFCIIEVKGNHNHNACGNIKYGHNATTGQGHKVSLASGIDDSNYNYTIRNNSTQAVTLTCDEWPELCQLALSQDTAPPGSSHVILLAGRTGYGAAGGAPGSFTVNSNPDNTVFIEGGPAQCTNAAGNPPWPVGPLDCNVSPDGMTICITDHSTTPVPCTAATLERTNRINNLSKHPK